jgi:TolB protein
VLALVVTLGACREESLDAPPVTDQSPGSADSASPSATASEPPQHPSGAKGSIAFQSNRDGDNDIYVFDLDSGEILNVTDEDLDDYHPEWSPDGDRIVFARADGIDLDLFSVDRSGQDVEQLTHDTSNEDFPEWSPDGAWIAFTSDRSGSNDIYVMRPDGSGARPVVKSKGQDVAPSWSPDGSSLVFQTDRSSTFDLYVVDLATGRQTPLVDTKHGEDEFPSWGDRIAAMVTNVRGNFEVTAFDSDGSGGTLVTRNGAGWPDWSPDGRFLAIASPRSGNSEIYIVNAFGAREVNITNDPAQDEFPAWSPHS